MTLEKQLWRGKACWKSSATSGPEFDWYNSVPMFRYNAYLGIHTVHTLDLVGHTGQHALPVRAFTMAAIQTLLARS